LPKVLPGSRQAAALRRAVPTPDRRPPVSGQPLARFETSQQPWLPQS